MSIDTPATRTVPPGLLYAQAAEYQARLVALEDQAGDALRAAWADAGTRIQGDLDALLARVAQARERGERVSPSWAFREARYRQALVTVSREAALFADTAARIGTATQGTAATMGATSAASLGSAATASLDSTFLEVNPDNLRHLAGFTQDGTPLADIMDELGPETLARFREVMGHGLVLGRGIDRMRTDLLRAVDMPRWRAETIVRTEAHRVFREASRETYARNDDVLEGWTWFSALDRRSCPACIAMHGTVHPTTDTLDGHPRCRCAMVPRVRPLEGMVPPEIQAGTEWLAAQPATTQRAVLGPAKFAAYRDGRLGLDDLVTRTENPRWGTMRREATLAEALESHRRPDLTRGSGLPQTRDMPTAAATLTPTAQATVARVRALLVRNMNAELVAEVAQGLDRATAVELLETAPGPVLFRRVAAAFAIDRPESARSMYRTASKTNSGWSQTAQNKWSEEAAMVVEVGLKALADNVTGPDEFLAVIRQVEATVTARTGYAL